MTTISLVSEYFPEGRQTDQHIDDGGYAAVRAKNGPNQVIIKCADKAPVEAADDQ